MLLILLITYEAKAQYFLFGEPRHGGFKVSNNNELDFSNFQHFVGSGILAVGFYKLLTHNEVKSSKSDMIKAGLLASGLGLLKEFEDGFREGWGRNDAIFNQLGILTFLILNRYSHYTFTPEYTLFGNSNYGLGVRFFQFPQVTPLKASLGFFATYYNFKKVLIGIDSHFAFAWDDTEIELHLGISLLKLQNSNQFHVRPNLGVGFPLF